MHEMVLFCVAELGIIECSASVAGKKGMCSIPSWDADKPRVEPVVARTVPQPLSSLRYLPSGTQNPVVLKTEHLGAMQLSVLDRLRMCSKLRLELKRLGFGAPASDKIHHVVRQPDPWAAHSRIAGT